MTLIQAYGAEAATAEAVGPIPGTGETVIVRSLAAIECEWRRFEATAVGHVFQTYAVVSTWLATVGRARGVAPLIIVGRDDAGRTLFILPFGIKPRFGGRQVEWLGEEHADYHAGLFEARFLERCAAHPTEFTAAITALLAGVGDVCDFCCQPATIAGFANPFAAHATLQHCDSSHETHLGSSWDSYYRAKRNSSSRRHDRGKLRHLEEMGGVTFIDAVSQPDVERAMSVLSKEKERSLGERGAGGFFASEAVKRFYRDLAAKPYPQGPCHVAALEFRGEIIAVNWGLVRGNRYYYVMHAFAAQSPAARFSPGRLLMYQLMQWCIARGIDIFDFTIGDEDFKAQWCEVTLPLLDSVVALNAGGAPLALALRSGKAAKRVIKANPALRGVAEEVRRRLSFNRNRPLPSTPT
jgi:CelD/BcsL family acetyltransferase involved in cellulose biosynthesis